MKTSARVWPLIRLVSTFTLVLLLGVVTGCETTAGLATADYGIVPDGYEAAIKEYFSSRLKDPYSAVYRFEFPRRAWYRDGLVFGGKIHYGFIVPVGLNAKNSYGGYVGEEAHAIFFRDGHLVQEVTLGLMAGFAD